MKEKDFSGADLLFLLFSLQKNLRLAFLTLIEGQKFSKGRPLILYLSLILPQTPLFTQPTKFYPTWQQNLASIRGLPQVGRILLVHKWLFGSYLFQDRLEDNQSITQIRRLGVYPALLIKHATSVKKKGKPSYCCFLNFSRTVSQYRSYLYSSKNVTYDYRCSQCRRYSCSSENKIQTQVQE